MLAKVYSLLVQHHDTCWSMPVSWRSLMGCTLSHSPKINHLSNLKDRKWSRTWRDCSPQCIFTLGTVESYGRCFSHLHGSYGICMARTTPISPRRYLSLILRLAASPLIMPPGSFGLKPTTRCMGECPFRINKRTMSTSSRHSARFWQRAWAWMFSQLFLWSFVGRAIQRNWGECRCRQFRPEERRHPQTRDPGRKPTSVAARRIATSVGRPLEESSDSCQPLGSSFESVLPSQYIQLGLAIFSGHPNHINPKLTQLPKTPVPPDAGSHTRNKRHQQNPKHDPS